MPFAANVIDDSPEICVVKTEGNGAYSKLVKLEREITDIAIRHRTQIAGILISPFPHQSHEEDKLLSDYIAHIHVVPRHSALTDNSPTMRKLREEIEGLLEDKKIKGECGIQILSGQELPIHLDNPYMQPLLPEGELERVKQMLDKAHLAQRGVGGLGG